MVSMILGEGVYALSLQFLSRIFRKVRDNATRARAFEAEQRFHHNPLAINPAILRRRLDHCVFPGNLKSEGRDRERL